LPLDSGKDIDDVAKKQKKTLVVSGQTSGANSGGGVSVGMGEEKDNHFGPGGGGGAVFELYVMGNPVL